MTSDADDETASGGQRTLTFASLRIENFRALKDVVLPLSRFGCFIGENNSGKSTALQALLLVLPASGRKATLEDFHDKTQPIRISLRIEGIQEIDLDRVAGAHRQSVANDVVDGTMTLVRVVTLGDGALQSDLRVERLVPLDDRWRPETLKAVMSGNTGAELRQKVVDVIPELGDLLSAKPTQKEVFEQSATLVAGLSADQMVARDLPIGTGIEPGLKGFLPEPIYIEAVKDLADEVKTTDSATFGKLLGVLLEAVAEQFEDIEQRFGEIQRLLSRVADATTGQPVDDRLDEVKHVEQLINNFVHESFPDVALKIEVPVPRMKTILAGASIFADDGHEGPVVAKGDGLKRAVAFAILRAYTALRSGGFVNRAEVANRPGYWLLFEEPELYLYPRAQRQLFRALEVFAQSNFVMVTTHSPIFFDADSTQSFVKFRKTKHEGSAPFTEVDPIEISDLPLKTAFQIICHENNNAGFFARKVVLVEGDSDAIIFAHIARLLGGSAWDVHEQNVSFVRTLGKGNIANYRLFFEKFKIPVHVIADLDVVVNGFEKLAPTQVATRLREELLSAVDLELLEQDVGAISETRAKAMVSSGNARALWAAVEKAREAVDGSAPTLTALSDAVHEFFAFSRKDERLQLLVTGGGKVGLGRQKLLDELADARVHVLGRGALESYYGGAIRSQDKVREAIEFASNCQSLEAYRAILGSEAAQIEAELRTVFKGVFA